ncbi:hypothetical protein GCM10023185_21190 [Hymenobacter saemangeumensis]|uniref:DUF4293 family protein n=1 Tax=Hymenobacter saemangeumensis TaxID=1084522 RepID=A0ABP8IDY6_9BACT
MERFRKWWFCSLGAAAANCLLIAATMLWLGKPWWLTKQPAYGWTIYPPLSALPPEQALQADPILGPYYTILYNGMLFAAVVMGALALAMWLLALYYRLRSGAQQRFFAVPVLLLIPLLVHMLGFTYQLYRTPTTNFNYEELAGNEFRVYGQGRPQPDSVKYQVDSSSSDSTE